MSDESTTIVLPDALVSRVAREELGRNNNEFQLRPDRSSGVVDEVVARSHVLASRLAAELEAHAQAAVHLRRILRSRRLWVGGLAAAAGLSFTIRYANFIVAEAPTTTGWVLLAVATTAALVGGIATIGPVTALITSFGARRTTARQLDRTLRLQISELIREILNQRLSPTVQWGDTFESVFAPTLVGISIDNAVSSRTYAKVASFIAEHPTSAIGIAGPRGVGKSTLMEQLRYDPRLRCLGVRIPAPKRYAPAALVRLIHRAVAEEVLGPGAVQRPHAGRPGGRMIILRRLIATLVTVATIVLLVWAWADAQDKIAYSTRDTWPMSTPKVFVLLGIGALAGLVLHGAWRALWQWRPLPQVRGRAERLARDQLDALAFSSDLQSKAAWSWTLGPIGSSGEDQINLTERQVTEADQVNRLRTFLEELHYALHGRPVVIGIDELDKIDKSEDVISIINGLKDLFHLTGIHVIVSVSTDAMHSFAARGVLVRDVFDSAFDTVLEVQRLNATESCEVLTRRATRFSVPAMLFCHVWSGGHPRDLIRTARACVQQRALQSSALPLAKVIEAVLLSDLVDVLRAAAEKVIREQNTANASNTSADPVAEIIVFRELLEELPGSLHERVAQVSQLATLPTQIAGDSEGAAMVRVLGSYVAFAVCVSEFFAITRTQDAWESEHVIETIRVLTETQTMLSRHQTEAARAVQRAQQRMHASAMPMSASHA